MTTNERVPSSSYQDPAFIAKVFLPTGLVYPLWHLFAPAGARDPWIWWLLVGSCFAAVSPLSRVSAFVRLHLLEFCTGCLFLSTLHLFALAHLNEMAPFFALGSVMSVVFGPVAIGTKRALGAFMAFVLCLTTLSFAIDPSPHKAAYWLPLGLLLGFYYLRLALQVTAAEREQRQRRELEQRVESRTRELSARTRELTEANEQLRRGIEERAILEEQLRTSQRMEAVGRLAGGIAHDFNNLLTTIHGYTELLMEAVSGEPRAREDVDQIQKACDRAASLTHQLLTFSRGSVTKTTVLDLDAVVAGMASMLRTVLGESSELEVSLDSSHCRIRGNRTQLEQVVLNLALNARDAMPEGGKLRLETSEVRREQLDSEELLTVLTSGSYVLLSATDTGVGMSAATRSRVFEPFFTTKEVGEGTGLGLSIAYGIVQQTGGHIRVSSEPQLGSRFELYWPVLSEVEDEYPVPAPPAVVEGASERILLVEDDPTVRGVTRRILRSIGYEVIEAADGESALRSFARGNGVDLVLTDVVMPRMSGIELAQQLLDEAPGLRVLFMSGNLDHPSLSALELPAGSAVLAKPFTLPELAASVRGALDQ